MDSGFLPDGKGVGNYLFKFVRGIMEGTPIDIYGEGKMRRDFTFVDDLVEGIVRLIATPLVSGAPLDPVIDLLSPAAPFRVVNVGGGQPVGLLAFIDVIEQELGLKALRNMMPMQKGDVRETVASSELLELLTGYKPTTGVEEGLKAFVAWYRRFYVEA